MTDGVRALAAGFPAADAGQWRALAEAALNGAGPDRALVRRTPAGLARGPLFTAADARDRPDAIPALPRRPFLPWDIRQEIREPDPAAANRAILADLEGGVSSISLAIDPEGRNGVCVRRMGEISTMLGGVESNLAPIEISAGGGVKTAALLAAWLTRDGPAPEPRGALGLAPHDPQAGEAARWALENLPRFHVVTVDAAAVHDAGGDEVLELAMLAAGAAEAMKRLVDQELAPDEAAPRLCARLAVDADFHLGICKLRAARRLWARVMQAFDVSEENRGVHLSAVTSFRMMTRRDAWTNLIRAAAAGFAGAAGGADSLTIQPLTAALGRPTPFARRLARNLQILLQEEAHAGRAADPAGGSYLHETLTENLAQAAWKLFQQIEREDGWAAALASGWLAERCAQGLDAARRALATSKAEMIGVNAWAQLGAEKAEAITDSYTPPPLNAPPIPDGDFAAMVAAARAGARLTGSPAPLPPPARLAEPFEALRDAAEAHAQRSGARPKAFLACLGGLSEFSPRAGFAAGRLAAGGIETVGAEAHESIDSIVKSFTISGAPLAVICGTDAAYLESAAALAGALGEAGAAQVWLAGPEIDMLNDAGVSRFINRNSDMLEDLAAAHAALGVRA
ncbi:MAG: hypothetical protein KIS81_10830 [Maricaulaceae bacterium]|nr:hypothetical protein [Maricaulaceae bacterium]